jgi:hypothetical protein
MSTFGVPDFGDGTFADGTVPVGDPGGSQGGSGSGIPIINSFTATPNVSTSGAPVSLFADVTGATQLLLDPGLGDVFAWPVIVNPQGTTTYILTAINLIGDATASVTVTVPGPGKQNARFHQVRRNDRLGDGPQWQMSAFGNPAVPNWPAVYAGGQNVIAKQPRGFSGVAQMADQTAGFTPGHQLVFNDVGEATDGGISSASASIYHIVFQFVGLPDDGQIVGIFTMPADLDPAGVTFPDGFAASRGSVGGNPLADRTYTFTRVRGGVSSSFCSMTVDTLGGFTFVATGDTQLIGGDRLVETAPSPQDAALSDVSATLAGRRS